MVSCFLFYPAVFVPACLRAGRKGVLLGRQKGAADKEKALEHFEKSGLIVKLYSDTHNKTGKFELRCA